MRTRISWIILAAAAWLAPAPVPAQYYEVPPVHFTGPFSHPRYEDGGFFVGLDALVWHVDRRIRQQTVAVRGFVDFDGTATGLVPPVFVGSGAKALDTAQLDGPGTWSPGFDLFMGWRFESGLVLTLSWVHLQDNRYAVSAGLLPPDFNSGGLLQNTFLFSPVSNFSSLYAGPRDLPQSTPPNPAVDPSATALYGIWNGADNMSIELKQRFDMVTLTARVPIWQTDVGRVYGLMGPRIIVMWDRFRWRTVDLDDQGNGTAANNAVYSNIVSNRFYGVLLGCGQEWFLGDVPVLGGFSFSLDVAGSLYGDWVKGRVRWEREDRATSASRARNFFQVAPGVEAKASIWWYPWEAVQVRIGYNVLALFNTIASERPIDFDMGVINPGFNATHRVLNGFDIGISFVF
ncbi:MAG: hypothetical protein NZO58_12700 [Gemmataceae bacterium]|nr:hypothetical protein [Gemmataceae bacterium]